MSTPFLGMIATYGFNFAPRGWAMCNGQILPIAQNTALFSLLGITYGGNGQTTFALPDLRGRTPIHEGNGHTLGEKAGQEAHTLTISELPIHTHPAMANSTAATTALPSANVVLAQGTSEFYHPATNLGAMN